MECVVAKILAIDPSSTEVGLFDGNMAHTIIAPKAPRPERLAYIFRELINWLHSNGPYDFVVYEEQFARGGPATRALYGAVGVIEAASVMQGAGTMSIPQETLRGWLAKQLGIKKIKRSEEKKAMAEVSAFYYADKSLETEHEKDAACLLAFTITQGEVNGN